MKSSRSGLRKGVCYSFMVSNVPLSAPGQFVLQFAAVRTFSVDFVFPHNESTVYLSNQSWRKMVSLLPKTNDWDVWAVGGNTPLRMMRVIFF